MRALTNSKLIDIYVLDMCEKLIGIFNKKEPSSYIYLIDIYVLDMY